MKPSRAVPLHVKPANKSGLALLAVTVCAAVIFLAFSTDQNTPVILPMMVAGYSASLFFWVMWVPRQGTIWFFEVGAVYVAVVSLYTLYPLVGFVVNGLGYTPFNDYRLFLAQPTPQEIGTVGWYYVVHLVSFIAVYLLVRGRLSVEHVRFPSSGRTTLLVAIFFYLAIRTFFLFLGHFFDLSTRSYSESYLVYKRLPLVLSQLSNHLHGARFTLELVILAMLFGNYHKWRPLIAGWLILMAVMTFVRLETRTELVLLTLSAMIMYHYLVRPISFRLIVLGGLAGLGAFTLLGILRSGWPVSWLTTSFNPFAYGSEFESLFANAYDLSRLRTTGGVADLPPTFYVADLLALVPQQFLPFEKISPSVWYVNTFYPAYAAAGGGLAFGTISESILGWDWVDLAGRGAVLGFILAKLHRHFANRSLTSWGFIFYAWVTVLVYQLFRNTTFSLLPLFFYQFLPVMLGIKVSSTILKGAVRSYRFFPLEQSGPA